MPGVVDLARTFRYFEKKRYSEIARILEISESRVCQLHGRALSRLRQRIDRDVVV